MSPNNTNSFDWQKLVIVVVALLLLTVVLGQAGSVFMAGANQHGGGYYPGLNVSNILVPLLYFLIKLLWLLLLVSVLAGLFVAFKKYVLEANAVDINPLLNKLTGIQYTCYVCQEKLNQEFKFCPKCKTSLKNQCVKCGKDLLFVWNCCPACGTEKTKEDMTHE